MQFKTTIIGRVGRDPETKVVGSGKTVTTYSVACNVTKEKTVWVKVTTWDKRAELDAQYVKRGAIVQVEGVLQSDENGYPRVYTNKDGEIRASQFELTGYNVLYIKRAEVDTSDLGGHYNDDELGFNNIDDDDVKPF